MCCDEAFGISKLGSEEEVIKITPAALTDHYHKILDNSRIEIFYCGSSDPVRVKAAIESTFKTLPDRVNAKVPKTDIIYKPPTDTPRRFTECLDVTQGKLALGFRMGDAMKNPDYPALMLFNTIYGGSVSSKLFLNVRERMSLCYYASSMIDKHKGIMIVSSGVEFSNFDAALDEILAQLESIKNGDVSELEFTSAKRYVITSVKSALDRLGGLEELYFDSVVYSIHYNPAKLSDMIENAALEQVVSLASGIKADTVYLLTGE
jgi:predicted Zn-dependent peptidase